MLLAGASVAIGTLGALLLLSPSGGRSAREAGTQPPSKSGPDAVWAPRRRAAPPFALRDQSNRLVSLAGQRGHVVLLAFMDSHCKVICKLEGPTIRSALGRVAPGVRVSLLVVSVNPWEDTAASSRAAAARWRLTTRHWHWLRGSPAQLKPVWRAYRIVVRKTTGDVSHSTAIYLIDGRGYQRAGFNYPFAAGDVARALRALGSPRDS